MSTSYYRICEPFTSLRLEEGPSHDKLTIWEHGANAGTLILTKGWGKRVALMFALHEEDNEVPFRSHWGGKDRGAIITIHDSAMADNCTVISEYGEILTVREVKARDGARRNDGMPTELFGYEKVSSPCTP